MSVSGVSSCANCLPPEPLRASSYLASSTRSADLTITTDEGDKVTLSFESSRTVEGLDYRDLSTEIHSRRGSIQASVEVSVEGDLSREEIRDIRKLAADLGKATKKAEKSDDVSIERIAHRFSKLDSLAAFDYSYQHNQEFEYSTLIFA